MAKIKVEYAGISEYEKFRLENIKRNEEVRSCTSSYTDNWKNQQLDFCCNGGTHVRKAQRASILFGRLFREQFAPAPNQLLAHV